jgi:hypothetical protein
MILGQAVQSGALPPGRIPLSEDANAVAKLANITWCTAPQNAKLALFPGKLPRVGQREPGLSRA